MIGVSSAGTSCMIDTIREAGRFTHHGRLAARNGEPAAEYHLGAATHPACSVLSLLGSHASCVRRLAIPGIARILRAPPPGPRKNDLPLVQSARDIVDRVFRIVGSER